MSSPTSQQLQTSSVENLSCSGAVEAETGTAVQTILTGRKCWRIMKGRDEAVWPPALEAALIEGLDQYKPAESRSTRALGRFPMRNKFVSDYIFQKTGKRRTPKQVGSRIQQLRDTSSGKQILKTFSDRHYQMMRPSRTQQASSGSPPKPRSQPEATTPTCTNSPSTSACSHVYIEVLPPSASHVQQPTSYPTEAFSPQEDFRKLGPRPLRHIDPTLTFVSSTQVPCYSSFDVLKDGAIVCSEVAPTEWIPMASTSANSTPSFLCRTSLVPKFWPQLCECEDPSAYTISHDIRTQCDPTINTTPDVMISVLYHFIDRTSPFRSLSPESVGECIELDANSLSAGQSPDIGSDFDMDMFLAPSDGGSPQVSSLGLNVDDLLMPELVHHGDDGYISLPPSPSVISFPAATSWAYAPKLGCDSVLSEGCETFFSAVPMLPPDALFEPDTISDITCIF